MRYIEIPQFPVLQGEQAVKALHGFIRELEEPRKEELTEKQTVALIKLAKGLISSIEGERQAATLAKDVKEKHFVTFIHSPLLSPLPASPHCYAVQKLI